MANSLLVKLGFDVDKGSVSDSVAGVNRITSALDGMRKSVRLITAGVGLKHFASGITSITGKIKDSVLKSYNMAEQYAATGDKIAKTSRLIGLSVKDYQAFSSAAQHAGMSTEEMDSALKRFSVNLGKARAGDKTSFKMFDSILGGKKLSDFKDQASLIAAVADGYKKLGSAEEKAFVSQELFGKSGLKMSELLSNGGDGVKKLIAEFEERGGGFTEDGAKNAELFNDELQNVRETFESLKISVAQELFPTFIDLFKQIQVFVRENRDEIIPVIREITACSANLVKSILPKIPVLLNFVLGLLKKTDPMVVSIGACVLSMLPAVGQIVIGVASLLPFIFKAVALVKGLLMYGHGILVGIKIVAGLIGGPVLATIGLVVAAVVSWGIAIKSIYDNWNLVGDAVDLVWTTIKESLSWWASGFWSLFIDPWLNFFKSVPGLVSGLVGGFVDGFSALGKMIVDFGKKIYDSIVGSVKEAWSTAKGILGNVPLFGRLFESSEPEQTAGSTLGESVARTVSESRTTTTNRFAVDFKNMPRGVQVTAPERGDFDWSRGYVLGGV